MPLPSVIKITVVTVTFNAAKVLRKTVDSVERQTYPAVEHIIVDGASSDGTPEIACDYMRRACGSGGSHSVRVVSEPDRGLYDAMNKGLSLATGQYVVYMNAGDCFHDACTLSGVAEKSGINTLQAKGASLPAVIYGDTDIVDGEGNYIGRRRHSPPEKLSWHSFRGGMLVCHQAFYARTDIARDIHYDLRYRYSADVDWCIRVMKEAERRGLPLVNVHMTVADYMREGQSTVHHRDSLCERFSVMRSHYGILPTAAMHVWFVFRAVAQMVRGMTGKKAVRQRCET